MSGNIKLAVDNAPACWNEAQMYGDDSPEWQALLNREMTLLLPGDKNRDAEQKKWKNHTARLRDWLEGGPHGSLTCHVERRKKGYMPIVFGASAGTRRTANAMVTAEWLLLDVESGDRLEDAEERVEELGLACLAYTSFNDGTQTSYLTRDAVLKALKIETDPTDEQVRQYLADMGKHRPEHIASVTIKNQHHHTEEGVKIELEHAPLEKWRLAFPLSEAVTITTLAPTQRAQQDVYARRVRGLAEMIGVIPDEACLDVSRAFFAPSHPSGADYYVAVYRGRGLAFEEIREIGRERPANARGNSLKGWAAQSAKFLELATLMENECPDKVRADKGGLLEVDCPFDHMHSNAGDPEDGGCHIRDADGDSGFQWSCKHNGCSGHDRLDMLAQALADGWFDRELIEEGSPYLILPDEDASEPATDGSEFELAKDWLPKRYRIKGGTIWTNTEDDVDSVPICAAFDVVGRSSNADGTDDAGRILSFVNENAKRVEVTISRADIAGDGKAVLRDLAAKGLLIYGRGTKHTERLLDLLNEITPKRRVPTVYVPGWVRDEHGEIAGFMHPTGVYDRVSGPQFRLLEGSRIEVVKTKGTLAGWKDTAQESLKYADSNFYWPLGLISGFAGPLLGILEWHPCGFSLSGLTSKGKTLAQLMGSAVWGSPEPGRGLLFTANTTGNAMEDLAVRGTDSFLGLDEIGAMSDKRALGSLLFAMSTGRTKSRKSGPGRGLTEGDSFRPFAVLSSEQGMRNEISGAGDKYRGGLAVRFPDIDVSEGKDIGADELAKLEAFKANYGHAGPIFIRYLIESGIAADRTKLEKEVLAIASRLAEGQGAAMARAARVFAIAQCAGELAADASLLGDVGKAKEAVKKAVKKAWDVFTASDEAGAATGGEALLDGLRSFLFGELNRRIIVMDKLTEVSDGHVNARGDVLGWADSDVIYLDSSKIKDPSVLGVDIGKRDELLRQLSTLGVLIEPGGKGHTFRQLPKDLAEGAGEEGAAVRNIRLCRKALP